VTLPLELPPRFRGHSPAIPVYADPAAITAGRFVKITGKNSKGAYKARHCTAGERPTGVAERSIPAVGAAGANNNNATNTCGPGAIAFVEAGAAVAVGASVTPDSIGRAVTVAGAAQATLTTGTVGANNAIVFTADEEGTDGNSIRVQLRDPAGNSQALSVDVDGQDIIVNLATDGSGIITSTAALVIAAVNEHDAASGLVTAANAAGSSGAGLVVAVALTALAGGTAGTNAFPAGIAETAASTAGDIIEVRLI
jgi:hypothetical protein